ncbi:MAG TPA: RNA polymerase subunit sigma-70 [Lachnospiraceae bacterium]|nr:RNA polymerase subunit sigma-70 [Lachnospiraceae bacterium]
MEAKETEKLARKAIKGNAKAYGRLIEDQKEYLYRMAYLYMKNEAEALDVVGDCILNGFKSISGLKNPQFFHTWLTRILINTAKSRLKKTVWMEDYDQLRNAAPEEGLSVEEKMDLHRAIDRLPDKYRTVVLLKYFFDMKTREIAYVMEIPEGTVKAYLSRARDALRSDLKEDYRYAN